MIDMTEYKESIHALRESVREFEHFERMFGDTFIKNQSNQANFLMGAAQGRPEAAELMLSYIRRVQAVADALDIANAETLKEFPTLERYNSSIEEGHDLGKDQDIVRRAREIIGLVLVTKLTLLALVSNKPRPSRWLLSMAFPNKEIKELKAVAEGSSMEDASFEDA